MCTTVPPAKSSVGNRPPSDAFSSPPLPHTTWGSGAYTTNNHRIIHSTVPLNFMYLAVDPLGASPPQECTLEPPDYLTVPAKAQAVAHQRPHHGNHRHEHEALHH